MQEKKTPQWAPGSQHPRRLPQNRCYEIFIDDHDLLSIPFFKRHGAYVHVPWMDLLLVIMCVKRDAELPILVLEHRAVPYSDQITRLLKDGIVFILGPRTVYTLRGCETNSIKLALEAVCGIGHVIDPVMTNDKRAFVYTRPHFFPRLRNMNALLHCFFSDVDQVVLKFRGPDVTSLQEYEAMQRNRMSSDSPPFEFTRRPDK